MTLTLWLVRHGETTSNAERTFQGHLDIALNERGEQQALALADYFRDQPFDAVYASDLSRAARTAELIAGPTVPVILDPVLREMHYGVLQGVRYADAASALEPHGLAETWRSGAFQRNGSTIPGGESTRRFRARSARFVERLDERYGGDGHHHVLVVAHGGQLGMLLTVLLGIPARARSTFRFANCSISQLTRTAERTVLDLHNLVVWESDTEAMCRVQSDRPHDPGEAHLPRR